MTTLTITLYLEDEPGKDSYELAKEIHSQVYNSGSKADPTMTIGKDYIVLDLHASKCPKKAPQSVLKAVSDSLDRVYSEGSKQGKNEKYRRLVDDQFDRAAYFERVLVMYGFPELHDYQKELLRVILAHNEKTEQKFERQVQ